MSIGDIIKKAIEITDHQPFLFIGSGISKRYLNTEKWDELLKHFCNEISDNEFLFECYKNTVGFDGEYGVLPSVASLIEKDYNQNALTLDKYKEFRDIHKSLLKNNVSAFKIAISEYLKSKTCVNNNKEIDLLKKIGVRSISGIITTNYDSFLESIFPNFNVFVGQEELIFSKLDGISEIYKIHGSVSKPESLVITSKDYELFDNKSSYLIAKLLTIFLEYPIIFMGYSLQDKNITKIFDTISKCLSQEKLDILKDRLIFIDYSSQEKITDFCIRLANGNSIPINCISTNNFELIYEELLTHKAKYNPTVLRYLRKDIYELAKNSMPATKIIATGFENLDDISKAEKFILGVGVVKNGHVIKSEQLYEDIVLDNQHFNPDLVVDEYLPELLKHNSGGLPMFKYLADYSKSLYGRVKANILKYLHLSDFLNDSLIKQKNSYHKQYSDLCIEKVIEIEGVELAYRKLILLEAEEIDCGKLSDYLKSLLLKNTSKCLKGNSELKRLIRIYDFLKYKNASANLSNSANT